MALYFGVSGIITVFITIIHMYGGYLGPDGGNPQVWYEVFGRYLDPIMTPLIAFGLIYYFSHTSFSWRIKAGLVAMTIVFVYFFPLGTYHPGATWAIIYLQYFKGIISHQLILFSIIGISTLILLRSYHEWFKISYIIMIFILINIPAAHFQIINGQTETLGLWVKRQFPLAEQVYVDESTVYSERLWRSVVFWNPSLKADYLNLSSDVLSLNKHTNGKSLLVTDKYLMDLKVFEDEFLGHKVYEIGNADYRE